MMKPVRRIFLVLGAMSMVSLFQFNAMGDDCVTNVGVGRYCKQRNDKRDCPKGCWCEGKIKKSTGNLDVDAICKGKQPTQSQLQVLHDAKVFICGIDNSGSPVLAHSNKKAKSSSDCILDNMGCISHEEGSYCSEGTNVRSCPKGCYCSGKDNDGKDQRYNQLPVHLSTQDVDDACQNKTVAYGSNFGVKNYLERRGVFYCPDGYNAATGAGSITECKNASGHFYSVPVVDTSGLRPSVTPRVCSEGYYLKGTGSGKYQVAECEICPVGHYCPGDNEKHKCTGFRQVATTTGQSQCSSCRASEKANADHTGCTTMSVMDINATSVQRDRIEIENLVVDPGAYDDTYTVIFSRGVAGNTTPSGNVSPLTDKRQGEIIRLSSINGFSATGYALSGWVCVKQGGGNVQISAEKFTMPAADVTCTAQWDCDTANGYVSSNNGACVQNSEYSCNAREYLNYDGQCVTCTEGYYCPGDDQRHPCNGQQYAQAGASSCAQCTNGTVDDNHTTCTPNNPNNSIECASGTYYPGSGNVCLICEAGYGCLGGTFTKNNGLVQGREKCMPEKVSNSDRSACAVCPDGSSPNNDYTGCVDGNGDPVIPLVTTCHTPGKYLDSDGYCVDCEDGYFCRGDDVRRNCPTGGASTTNGQSCKFSLDEGDLAYGLGTTNRNCWKYLNKPVQYRTCVYGINIDSLQ